MAIATFTRPDRAPPDVALKRNGINQIALALVWLTIAASSIVFTEPAPADALTFGLIVMLPLVGLFALRRTTYFLGAALAVIAASVLIGITQVTDDFAVAEPYGANFFDTVKHGLISIYLLISGLVFAGFVALRPYAHTRLIFSGILFAGTMASVAALAGYFGVHPLARELFVVFDRAAGTFKDPNVLGAFLVLPMLVAAHMLVNGRGFARLTGGVAAAIFVLTILLTFSRGAWLMLTISGIVFTFLAFCTARTHRNRLQMVLMFTAAILGALVILGTALQSPDIAEFFAQRAQTTQSYDAGPEGRFGGQVRAVEAILANPFGIGGNQFTPRYHPENPHNVYLMFFLKGGWLGGFVNILVILATLTFGLKHALKRTSHQQLFQVAFAAFVGLAALGFIIDTDHWRHFYLNAGLVWGMMAAARPRPPRILSALPARRPPRIIARHKPRNISPDRRNTILGPARRRLRKDLAGPRRARHWRPRRPQRIAYGAANDA